MPVCSAVIVFRPVRDLADDRMAYATFGKALESPHRTSVERSLGTWKFSYANADGLDGCKFYHHDSVRDRYGNPIWPQPHCRMGLPRMRSGSPFVPGIG